MLNYLKWNIDLLYRRNEFSSFHHEMYIWFTNNFMWKLLNESKLLLKFLHRLDVWIHKYKYPCKIVQSMGEKIISTIKYIYDLFFSYQHILTLLHLKPSNIYG